MSLDFDTLELLTASGPRTAMVITPVEPVLVAARTYVPEDDAMSEADEQILEGARRCLDSSATVCIFRGQAPVGEGRYAFDPNMTEGQAVETALAMLSGQMRVYREMLRLGICLFLHTDLGLLEVHGFRGAVARRIAELETRPGVVDLEAKRAQLDLWMLRNLNFFFTLGFDKLIATILPDKLSLMEKRMERIRRLAHEVD